MIRWLYCGDFIIGWPQKWASKWYQHHISELVAASLRDAWACKHCKPTNLGARHFAPCWICPEVKLDPLFAQVLQSQRRQQLGFLPQWSVRLESTTWHDSHLSYDRPHGRLLGACWGSASILWCAQLRLGQATASGVLVQDKLDQFCGTVMVSFSASPGEKMGLLWMIQTIDWYWLLVAGLEHLFFFHILGTITPTDFFFFFRRGWNHQPHCMIVATLYTFRFSNKKGMYKSKYI